MTSKFDYQLIRSNRKTLAIQIGPNGLVVRAPYRASQLAINEFLQKNSAWIEKNLEKQKKQQENRPPVEKLSMEEIRRLAEQATVVIPKKVRHYAPLVGVTYGRITIRNQSTRWGSCSSQGNLNFNCFLMLAPKEVQEYVVIHELAHRKEMNHSKAFWKIVQDFDPKFEEHKQWLKTEEIKFRAEGK